MLWKIYFWLVSILIVIIFGVDIKIVINANQYDNSAISLKDVIIIFIGLIGLYAFSYKKKILSPKIWQVVFMIIIINEAITTLDKNPFAYFVLDTLNIIYISIIIFFLPYYYALYLYSYKSDDIWRGKNITKIESIFELFKSYTRYLFKR